MMPCMAGCAGPRLTCRCSLPPLVAPSPRNSSRVVRMFILEVDACSHLRADERLAPVHRVVLAQRMAHELLVEEQTPEIGMPFETHAEHVPHLALEPVGDGPEPAGGGDSRIVLLEPHLEAQPVIVRGGVKMIHDLETGPVFAPREPEIVHG